MSQQIEQALASIVIPKLHLFQVEREFFFRDAVELDEPFLSIAPETLNAVYVNLAVGKELFMVYVDMTIAAEHKRVVALKLVGIDDAAAPHSFNRKVKERARLNVLDSLDLDHSVTLQDAENRHFSGRPSASLAFASASEVALVHLDHSAEKLGGLRRAGNDGCAYNVDRFKDRRIAESGLLSDPPGRELKLEQLYNPEPVLVRDSEPVNPPSGKIMEGVAAPLATEPFTDYPIDFTASAACAKTMAVFPTQLCEEEPRGIL